jgi:hypothetical protein
MNETIIHLGGGVVRGASSDTLEEIAGTIGCEVNRRRFSHVVPAHFIKRQAFRVLRFIVGERGHIATWCRSWYGPWQVRFADRPFYVAFTHQSRRVCIEWEVARLNERLANELSESVSASDSH